LFTGEDFRGIAGCVGGEFELESGFVMDDEVRLLLLLVELEVDRKLVPAPLARRRFSTMFLEKLNRCKGRIYPKTMEKTTKQMDDKSRIVVKVLNPVTRILIYY
jgi:hypothetical protein